MLRRRLSVLRRRLQPARCTPRTTRSSTSRGNPDTPHTLGRALPQGRGDHPALQQPAAADQGAVSRARLATSGRRSRSTGCTSRSPSAYYDAREKYFIEKEKNKDGQERGHVNRLRGDRLARLGVHRQRGVLPPQQAEPHPRHRLSTNIRRESDTPPRSQLWGPRSVAGAMTTNLIDIQNSDVIMATSQLGRESPGRLPVGDEGQGARGQADPRRPPLHAHQRGRRHARAAALRHQHRVLRRADPLRDRQATCTSRTTSSTTPTPPSSSIPPSRPPTDLERVCSPGIDPGRRGPYDRARPWKYQLDGEGNPTPRPHPAGSRAASSSSCGGTTAATPPRWWSGSAGFRGHKFEEVAQLFCGTSGPDKTGAITYALNLTQHTNGVAEHPRAVHAAAAARQRRASRAAAWWPCAATPTSRGPPTSSCSITSCRATSPMPLRDQHPISRPTSRRKRPRAAYWTNRPKFMVSLLKAFYGDGATKENEFGYQWLPKRAAGRRLQPPAHVRGHVRGQRSRASWPTGQNPAVGGPNAKLARAAMGKLDWLLVVDIFLTETAEFWKAPGDRRQGHHDRGVLPAGRPRRREGRQRSPTRCG